MARGKKTGGKDFSPGRSGNPGGRPRVAPELAKARSLNRLEFERILNKYVTLTGPEINTAIRSQETPILELCVAKVLAVAFNEGDPRRLEFILDRLIGKPKDMPEPTPQQVSEGKVSFDVFCERAGYPKPYEPQHTMREFGLEQTDPRMILGARNYGKTDYVVILGTAYDIYLDPMESTNLVITKSGDRSSAIIKEIQMACEKNGVVFSKANSTSIRVAGLIGKDPSVAAVTIRTASFRGRHPKRIFLDDPVTEDDTSEATRKLVKKKWNEILKLSQNVCVIGQPAHKFDLYAELRGITQFKRMELPYGSIPELDVDLEAQRLAGVDEASIQASYFLKIVSEGTTPFDNVRYMDRYPTGGASVAWIDPSHMGGDFTAVTILKAHGDGFAVVGFVYKKAWNHCLDPMVAALMKYGVKKVAFESNALGDQPVIMLRELLGQAGVGVVGIPSIQNKHAKIMAAGAYAHLIHLSRESDPKYLEQVTHYEYGAKVDDAPDSLASCLKWIGFIR